MKLVLLPLALLVVLARANNEDGVVYDAFAQTLSPNYMYQNYAVQDCSSVQVSQENAVIAYNLDFSREVAATIRVEAAANYAAGYVTEILVHLDTETATPIATVSITDTGSDTTFLEFTASVSPAPTDIHRVFLTFTSNAPNPILNLGSFQFLA